MVAQLSSMPDRLSNAQASGLTAPTTAVMDERVRLSSQRRQGGQASNVESSSMVVANGAGRVFFSTGLRHSVLVRLEFVM
jgi:hypothetical protein